MKSEMTVQENSFKSFAPKKVFSLFLCLALVLCMSCVCFADETTTVAGVADFQNVIDAMTSQINIETIFSVVAALIGVCIGMVFVWWGVRKIASMVMSAFKKGKLSV